MDTYTEEKKELLKDVRALEKKELHIGIGYRFKRVHGDCGCVKVVSYDNEFVKIHDVSGEHYVPRVKFNSDYFKKGA